MEFVGQTPLRVFVQCPTTFSETTWKQIETSKIDYSSDLIGWQKKFLDELALVEPYTAVVQEDLARWINEQDFVIRLTRSYGTIEITKMYEQELAEQTAYMNRVNIRFHLVEKLVEKLTEEIKRQDGGKKKKNKQKRNKNKQNGQQSNSANPSTPMLVNSAPIELQL